MTTETTTTAPVIEGELVESTKQAAVATRQAAAALNDAQALVIDDQITYDAAAADLTTYRSQWKQLDQKRIHLKAPALETCRRIDELFRAPLQQLEQAGKAVAAAMEDFAARERARVQREQAEARRLEQERLAAIERDRQAALQAQRDADAARELAERQERERLQRIADEDAQRQRDADAAAAAAVAADPATIAAAQAKAAEEEAALAAKREEEAREAQRLREDAERQAAAAAAAANAVQTSLDMAAVTPALPVSATAAKASGVATRTTWKATNIDKRALVLGVAAAILAEDSRADELLTYLDVNESSLNQTAKQLKASARVPGVMFAEHVSVASTGRRR